ncbi:MAG TPA: GNAT family N-acetyltransferase [Pyrinomonadaceae bacterium]|nr:GNAT family N-acetyltransferase [Pyrinomonadaceae bacterium]
MVEICAELKDDFRELAAEAVAAKETPYINWDGDFEDYLRRMQILASGENIPAGEVPRTTYFLFCGEKIIGRSEIRRELNDELKLIGGHLGADIRRSERRKGFGILILRLTLEKAKELGLEKVLITCDKNNIASAKTIEKCGGVFEKEIVHGETGATISHYWIEL